VRVFHYLPRILLAEGGPVRSTLDVCAMTVARGHRAVLLATDIADAPREWVAPGASNVPEVIRIDRPAVPPGFFDRAQMRRVRELVEPCDLLHLHAPWFTENIQLARLADRLGRPYVLTLHGMLDDWCMAQKGLKKRIFLLLAGRRMLEGAVRIQCASESERIQSSKWYPGTEAVVFPHVLDLSEFRSLPGPDEARRAFPALLPDGRNVLYLGRLHHKKGPDVLIRALGAMARRKVDARVFFAGAPHTPAYQRELESIVAAEEVSDRVHFLGVVTGRLKWSLYQACDVFALPTSQENFGFVYPEALACETPVITTRGAGLWSELESSGAAVIVERAPAPFADAIARLLADADLRAQMGRRGRAWVFEYLDTERIVDRLMDLYRIALDHAPRRGKR
jgi:glycosyltransferase involved in cell wall biosynthesis